MAKLASGKLSSWIQFAGLECGWVQYHLYLQWNGENVVRDELLKRRGEYWGSRPKGAFLANELENDSLLPFVKRVLDEDKADYWEPLEPDVMIAIYPESYFPFLKPHYGTHWESPESKAKREARQMLKKEKGKLPDDSFTVIVVVDAYNLKEATAYYGQGFSLHLIVTREDLEQFARDLESEYMEFKERVNMDEALADEDYPVRLTQ